MTVLAGHGVLTQGGLRAWARRHAYSLFSSLGTLLRHPVASAMTIIVLGVALVLPAGLWLLLDNASRIGQDWERLDTLSVFLDEAADEAAASRLASRLSTWDQISAVDPISPAAALAELGGQMGIGDLTEALEDNPLPWVLEITPAVGADLPVLADRVREEPEVDLVMIDLQWLERFEAMVEVVRQLTLLLAVLFALAVAFIVGNTIRMDIQNRREEIEVLDMVGATSGFIRRPFLYSGLWFGLAGGLLAWIMLTAAVWLLSDPVAVLGDAYGVEFSLRTLPVNMVLLLVCGSGILGISGSWLAVGRHLRAIQP